MPAGSALAVDRDSFCGRSHRAIERHPNIAIVRERVDALPDHPTIIATGPLTGSALAEAIAAETGQGALAFFDAIAPIVHRDSIDMDICWMAARWDKGGKDYINCPLDKEQYEAFVQALLDGEKTEFKEWEKDTPYFEGCMPIEVMAERGVETLRFGPMKGVGLDNPRTGRWPYAVVQLRQDNALGTLVEHGRLPDQAEARRAGPHLPHHSRAGKCRVRAARRDPPQQLHQLAAAARPRAAPEVEAATSASPARSPAAKAMSKAPRSACSPRASPRPNCGGDALPAPPPETALGACSATSPAAPMPRASSR